MSVVTSYLLFHCFEFSVVYPESLASCYTGTVRYFVQYNSVLFSAMRGGWGYFVLVELGYGISLVILDTIVFNTEFESY